MADATVGVSTLDTGVLPGGGIWSTWQVFTDETVNGTGVVDSIINSGTRGYELGEFKYFGLWFNAQSSSGTADVKVEILESYNDTAANYVSPNSGGTIVSSHGETAKVYSVTPTPMRRLRLRVTGNSGNPTDTLVNAVLFLQT